MIKQFKHKGLEVFFNSGSKKGILPSHSEKIARILDRLDASTSPQDMDLPGYRLHELKGKDKETFSAWVNGNWRITFRFIGEDAYVVDYKDCH